MVSPLFVAVEMSSTIGNRAALITITDPDREHSSGLIKALQQAFGPGCFVRPQLPMRQGPVTITAVEAEGNDLVYTIESDQHLDQAGFEQGQRIEPAFFEAAFARAVEARSRFAIDSDGVRLVHGESDGLPGLIVDRYGDTLVAQFSSAGAQRWKAVLAEALAAAQREGEPGRVWLVAQ